jgi:hypothetical protein
MKTLNVSISDVEYNKFGLKNNNITFTEFCDIITKELAKQQIERSVQLSEQYGLSDMSMDDINLEIKNVRNKKSDH